MACDCLPHTPIQIFVRIASSVAGDSIIVRADLAMVCRRYGPLNCWSNGKEAALLQTDSRPASLQRRHLVLVDGMSLAVDDRGLGIKCRRIWIELIRTSRCF